MSTSKFPIVKYSNPQKGEEDFRFFLIEDNGDRVLIEWFNSGFTISPTMTVAKKEIEFV